MAAERFDDLPALGEIRAALEREATTPRAMRRRPTLRGLPVLAGALVPVVVLVVAVVVLHRGSSPSPAVRSGVVAGRQALIDELAVLRRPQTAADLPAFLRERLNTPLPLQGRADLPLVRYAATTPWGARVYLVPSHPPTAAQLKRLHVPAGYQPRFGARGETVGVFTQGAGSGGADATSIRSGGSGLTSGSEKWTRILELVPDGVATVTFVVPRQPEPGVPFTPTYARSETITVAVHGNIAAVQIDRPSMGVPMIWRDPSGHVIKRIGDFRDVNRVVAEPRPGPATPASRAAERNPATPNPVWVTPAVGGARTHFEYHFWLLLSDADYRYQLTGPRCPAIHVDGDGDGGASGLRGRLWTDSVSAISTARWCPGTYRLSAFVSDYGLHGRQSGRVRAARETTPFGTATFTVR